MPFATALGGAELLLQTFLERAGSIAVEPHVVFFEEGPWAESLRGDGIGVSVVAPGRFRQVGRNVSAAAELRGLLKAQAPDITFGWITRAQVTLAPAAVAAGLGRTLVWYQHALADGPLDRVATLLPAQRVFACSGAVADSQRALWPHRTVELAYPGIDAPEPRPEAEVEALRAALEIPAGRAVVGVVGRLQRWKRQDRLVEALGILRSEGRDVHGLIIGGSGHGLDLDFEPEVRALVTRLGLDDRITFTGQVDDARVYTQLLDVSVNTSDDEPFGIVLLEAMALGTPVVAPDTTGPREILAGGVGGLLVESPAPDSIARGIAEILDDPERGRELARDGRRRVLERFSTERWLEGVRAGLDAVAGSG